MWRKIAFGPAAGRWLSLVPVLLLAALLAGCAGTATDAGSGLVVVAGASGRTGRFVLEELRRQGIPYRALTRSQAAALERLGEGYARDDWREVDVRDPAQVDRALAGASYVISVIGTREVKGPNSAEFVDYGGVKNLVDAARRHGVRHFVLLTAIGVTDPGHPLNRATNDTLRWRFRGEEYLRDSGIPYTIVRPAGLRDEPAGTFGGMRLDQGDDWKAVKGSVVSRADIAALLVLALREPALERVTVEAVADRSLAPDDWRSRLAGLSRDPPRP